MWVAVLVLNILGFNWMSRFLSGRVIGGLGVMALWVSIWAELIWCFSSGQIHISMFSIHCIIFSWIPSIILTIIWIVDLVKIGTGNWRCADGSYLFHQKSLGNNITNKRCRQCNQIYVGASYVCPYCGSSLFEETNQNSINMGDTWLCKKCKETNMLTAPSCKSCGHYK